MGNIATSKALEILSRNIYLGENGLFFLEKLNFESDKIDKKKS